MSESFFFAVTTPDRDVAGGQCEFLVIPTSRGELGVLANHAPLLASVVAGELRVHRGNAVEKIRVGSGIVEARDNTVRLLVLGP
jgi:F-type H+-transporting ATPase subunit epsilon